MSPYRKKRVTLNELDGQMRYSDILYWWKWCIDHNENPPPFINRIYRQISDLFIENFYRQTEFSSVYLSDLEHCYKQHIAGNNTTTTATLVQFLALLMNYIQYKDRDRTQLPSFVNSYILNQALQLVKSTNSKTLIQYDTKTQSNIDAFIRTQFPSANHHQVKHIINKIVLSILERQYLNNINHAFISRYREIVGIMDKNKGGVNEVKDRQLNEPEHNYNNKFELHNRQGYRYCYIYKPPTENTDWFKHPNLYYTPEEIAEYKKQKEQQQRDVWTEPHQHQLESIVVNHPPPVM